MRRGTRREIPQLLSHRHLPPLGRTARTLTTIGGALAAWLLFEWRRPSSRRGISRRLRKAFEHLGPTYIKLGQILSSGEGVFPPELVGEFRLLRDRVPAEPLRGRPPVVEADLGRPLEAVFDHFETTPIAAASIAQVHAARLCTGEDVVVKVQRPQVASLVRHDIAAMSWLAPHLIGRIPVASLANPPALVELFAETIVEELDFRLEADNMLDIAAVLASTGQRAVVVPRPHPELVTRRVLVMERLDGFGWDDVDGMRRAGIDTNAVVRALLIVVPGRGDPALRRLPRRPARRQPLRPARRAGGTARLRDNGAAGRGAPPGLPAPADGREPQRPAPPAGRPAGHRAPSRPTPTSTPWRSTSASTSPWSTRCTLAPESLLAEVRDLTKTPARVRGRVPEGTHAVREGPAVRGRRHRHAGTGPRHDPADDGDLHVLRLHARRAHPARGRHRRVARPRPTPRR